MESASSKVINQFSINQDQAVYAGVCRGALGELFQGPSPYQTDEIVIISSLISQYSRVYFTPIKNQLFSKDEYHDLIYNDPNHKKAFKAAEIFCQLNNLPLPIGQWEFSSDLPVSRGMASSTADIVATIRCLQNYYNKAFNLDNLLKVLFAIERSDSVFLNNLTLFCSSHHKIIQQFGKLPPLYALFMHEENTIETDDTKEILINFYQRNFSHYTKLYSAIIQQFTNRNLKQVCQLSTRSSELSQEILPKKHFYTIHQKMADFYADGIITAHTGSAIGYLFVEKPQIESIESITVFFKKLGGKCQLAEIG
ncbi:hypothetical protein [Aliikangiella maris]|uniref:GHMP kinase N-terminal domain-containing protein n=2 Tax=Aliikangiella maris TaxID=3162458 RepID=A0ABV2BUM1_9GAMM